MTLTSLLRNWKDVSPEEKKQWVDEEKKKIEKQRTELINFISQNCSAEEAYELVKIINNNE